MAACQLPMRLEIMLKARLQPRIHRPAFSFRATHPAWHRIPKAPGPNRELAAGPLFAVE